MPISMRQSKRRTSTKTAKPGQQDLPFPKPRGGAREGAGRPRNKSRVSHASRAAVKRRLPMLVTVRMRSDVPRLRNFALFAMLRRAFIAGCDKGAFRIVQFSVQTNHIHLICEADDNAALARGMQGWAVRVARGLNSKLGRRGTVFAARHHLQITPG